MENQVAGRAHRTICVQHEVEVQSLTHSTPRMGGGRGQVYVYFFCIFVSIHQVHLNMDVAKDSWWKQVSSEFQFLYAR